jgi:quercetin dioxygenase-like cupin family protein
MTVINQDTAQHYGWGQGCEGWILVPSSDLLIIQEKMPVGTEEHRHFHSKARQFFFVLQGQLTMELDGIVHKVPAMSGIEIAPNCPHQARNNDDMDVEFLVVSSPTTRGDRTDIG